MILVKITSGFVSQFFDTKTKKYTEQSFTAGDDVSYENTDGETVDSDLMLVERGDIMSEPYLPFDMVQPGDMGQNLAHAQFVPNRQVVLIEVDEERQDALSLVTDLANENALDRRTAEDNDLKDDYLNQQKALTNMSLICDEVRRGHKALRNKTVQVERLLTPYQQVIKDIADDVEDNDDGRDSLIDLALDAMRSEIGKELNRRQS